MRDAAEKPVLDPLSRCSEAIFGLLMALSFTGAVTITSQGDDWIRQVIIAALTCNIAWGLTDAAMYLLSSVIERGRRARINREVLAAAPSEAVALTRAEISDWANAAMTDAQVGQLVEVIRAVEVAPIRRAPIRDDLRAALAVFVTVVLATFPPILPLLFVQDPDQALRLSNLVSLLFLVFLGAVLDRLIGARFRFAWIMPLVGAVLVAIIIALGG